MRRRAFLTTQQAAELLDVTHKTLQNWEKGRVRIPYTAYRVLKIKVGYVFHDEYFSDWFMPSRPAPLALQQTGILTRVLEIAAREHTDEQLPAQKDQSNELG